MIPWLLPLLAVSPAQARNLGMDPMVRVHLGASWVAGPSGFGVTGGMDARFGRLLYLDLAGALSPVRLPMPDDPGDEGVFFLRHALWLTPGLRIPHRQPEAWRWEVFLRAGPAVAWSAWQGPLSTPRDDAVIEADAAATAGVDVHLRRGPVGLSASVRAVVAQPYDRATDEDRLEAWPLVGLEGSYTF